MLKLIHVDSDVIAKKTGCVDVRMSENVDMSVDNAENNVLKNSS